MKEDERMAQKAFLDGKDVLALLSTGKCLIYQLALLVLLYYVTRFVG